MRTSDKKSGFTLVEVMAAVTIIGIGMVSFILAINRAKETARITRNIKAVRNLAANLLSEIEVGKFDRLYDGMSGNFASAGFPEFQYEIGIGEDSAVSAASEDLRTEEEKQKDADKKQAEENAKNSGTTTDPNASNTSTDQNALENYEQITVRVSFKTLAEQPTAFVLVKKIQKALIDGNFDKLKTTQDASNANASTNNSQPTK